MQMVQLGHLLYAHLRVHLDLFLQQPYLSWALHNKKSVAW